ncbi:MAG: sulfur carrier protein ThiS [Phycisphaerae bacterium]|nr:sulfur carrier protein ThiS [Phycisphaerae bacterium]
MGRIKVNGVEKEFGAGEFPFNLSELLEMLKVDSATVVAEIGGDIIERSKFSETVIEDGDSVELIRFVPGG